MIELGIKGRQETTVSPENTAAAVGSGLVSVFATPMMIALVEKTAATSIAPFLEEGESSVGTHIDISHCAATPVGMKVWAESEVTLIDRRRVVFRVAAYDERGLIGEGTHERFIINAAKFQQKADTK